jgi:MFS superfamily sulfate permease-like transporter
MVDTAGGRSQLAHLVTVGIVLVVLLFLTGPLSYLPKAVLAAIVFAIGIRLIDLGGLRTIRARRPVEFGVALLTALTVVIVSVGWGIAIAAVLSIIAHLRHSYRPVNVLLFQTPEGRWDAAPLESWKQALPGLAIYRFGADLYYANESRFSGDVHQIVRTADPPLRWLCLSAMMMADIDFSGSESLKQIRSELQGRGVELVISDLGDEVARQLERDGIIEAIGRDHVFDTFSDAASAFRQSLPQS